jgi:alpha-tubulin suppressor-like RCC1 family protein
MKISISRYFLGFLLLINVFYYKLNAQTIAAGYEHSLFICSDSTVKTWGDNSQGQLGYTNSDITSCHCKNYPVKVVGLTEVVCVAAGYQHSLAVKSDGTV